MCTTGGLPPNRRRNCAGWVLLVLGAACGDDAATSGTSDASTSGSATGGASASSGGTGASGGAGASGGMMSSTGGGGATTFTISGTVTGIHGSATLSLGGELISVSAEGLFSFPTAIADGTPYAVAIDAQPSTQRCSLANAAGTVNGADITNVTLECEDGLFFPATNGTDGIELWFTDGTSARTHQVLDINPTGDSEPFRFMRLNDKVFFRADDGTGGRELWVTDGTALGTRLVVDLNPLGGSDAEPFLAFNGELFFTGDNQVGASEMWKIDAAISSLIQIKSFSAGDYRLSRPVVLGNAFLFSALEGPTALLFRSDGTAAGTSVLVPSGPSAPIEALLYGSEQLGSMALFEAFQPTTGRELWKSDGTLAGTSLLKDIKLDGAFVGSSPRSFARVGSRVCFTADDGINGREIHCSDGTLAGTGLLAITPEPGDYGVPALVEAGGALYFIAVDSLFYELWKTDGTTLGTTKVLAGVDASAGDIHAFGSRVLFTAEDVVTGRELWISDGSAAGTQMLKDVAPPGEYGVYSVLVFGSRALFYANDGVHGIEPWITDGTTAGTQLLLDLNPTGDSYASF